MKYKNEILETRRIVATDHPHCVRFHRTALMKFAILLCYLQGVVLAAAGSTHAGRRCPSATGGKVDCLDLSHNGNVVVNNQAAATQRNYAIHVNNASSFTVQIDQSQTPTTFKYTNLVALLSTKHIPSQWDVSTAQFMIGKFGKYWAKNESVLKCNWTFYGNATHNSVSYTNVDGGANACFFGGGASVPLAPSSNKNLDVYSSAKMVATEEYNVLSTVTNGAVTSTTVKRYNRTFMKTTLYMSVYCQGKCAYSIAVENPRTYVADACPTDAGAISRSAKNNTGLCCPAGCSQNGTCLIDGMHGTSCTCNQFRVGGNCETYQLPVYMWATIGYTIFALLMLQFYTHFIKWFLGPELALEFVNEYQKSKKKKSSKWKTEVPLSRSSDRVQSAKYVI